MVADGLLLEDGRCFLFGKGSLLDFCCVVHCATLGINIAQMPHIIGCLGSKALKCKSFEGKTDG